MNTVPFYSGYQSKFANCLILVIQNDLDYQKDLWGSGHISAYKMFNISVIE
jgi:hypothetical protein